MDVIDSKMQLVQASGLVEFCEFCCVIGVQDHSTAHLSSQLCEIALTFNFYIIIYTNAVMYSKRELSKPSSPYNV